MNFLKHLLHQEHTPFLLVKHKWLWLLLEQDLAEQMDLVEALDKDFLEEAVAQAELVVLVVEQ
jgi:hypothetical protein